MQFLALLIIVTLTEVTVSQGDTANTPCIPGWEHVDNGCYKYYSSKPDAFEAESICNQFQTSTATGHLVSIGSEEENNLLLHWWMTVRDPESEFVRIGFTDLAAEGEWKWFDGSTSDHTNWADTANKEPDNEDHDCAIMSTTGTWYDDSCDAFQPFVCEYDL